VLLGVSRESDSEEKERRSGVLDGRDDVRRGVAGEKTAEVRAIARVRARKSEGEGE